MLILTNCGIYNPPKCGSHWMQCTLLENNIVFTYTHMPGVYNPACEGVQFEVLGPHSSHCYASHIYVNALRAAKYPILTVVREPLSWLRSYYAWRERSSRGEGWKSDIPLTKLRGNSFNEFVDNVIDAYPDGLVGRFFESFTDVATHVIRVEEMTEGFQAFLEMMGFKFDKISDVYAAGNSGEYTYTMDQAEKMIAQNKDFCDRWGYRGIPEEVVE